MSAALQRVEAWLTQLRRGHTVAIYPESDGYADLREVVALARRAEAATNALGSVAAGRVTPKRTRRRR